MIRLTLTAIFILLLLGRSSLSPEDPVEQIRAYTRELEFDFVSWSLSAMWTKLSHSALSVDTYLPSPGRKDLVLDYLGLVNQIQSIEGQINAIFTDPSIADPQAATYEFRKELQSLHKQQDYLKPIAEAVIQNQITEVVAELGLGYGGQPIPPILYHSTPLPTALVVSPRETIEQKAMISLQPDLAVEQRVFLEDRVDTDLDVSSLVVNIGGIAVYPTMILQTTNMNYITEIVAHEWIHNYFTLRPLGLYYFSSPESRTINETAATIGGKEIGRLVMERYYPELLPPPPPEPPEVDEPPLAPVFNFRAEMHTTRLVVDDLLAEGKVEEAEAYMEERRRFFWDHGYQIRKLNQAYFAFHGAYADHPEGPAGDDPVGEAVRQFFKFSPSLTYFIERIAWITSLEQLQLALEDL
ncbi:MAG: hypothetical protein ACNA8H_08885 [Anaerolineales bacterium]